MSVDHDHDHAHATEFTIEPLGRSFQSGDRPRPWPHSSDDPTATKTIRDRYAGEMYRRFRALKGAIRESIVARNAFGDVTSGPGTAQPTRATILREMEAYPIGPPGDPDRFPDFDSCVDAIAESQDITREEARRICGKWQQRIEGDVAREFTAAQDIEIEPTEPNEFDFPADQQKVAAFMDWLDRQVERGILETTRGPRSAAATAPWQDVFLRQAYVRGVFHADAVLTDEGIIAPAETIENVFRAPQHADAAGLIFTRAYRELDGVTNAMGQDISRVLADGITQGWNPRKTAREINDRVDKVGIHRGRLIARTESIRAHNEAALNRYQDVQQRISGVTALAEFLTAGDNRVCPVCLSLEGNVYRIEEARGLIPVHPNCRCTWLPVPETANRTALPASARLVA